MGEFNCFVGVDQTGSVDSSGLPKPLPVFAIVFSENKWRFVIGTSSSAKIKTFQYSSFEHYFHESQLGNIQDWNCLILVDCVLGLPDVFAEPEFSSGEQLHKLMREASQTPQWGLAAGHEFFSNLLLLKNLSQHPKRRCEIELKANSVFAHRPFQKNIQTGTFRAWKDLGSDPESLKKFVFWPFETQLVNRQRPTLAEGYPSLAWQSLSGGKRNTRSLQIIIDRLEAQIEGLEEISRLDKDSLDAALLAIWGWFTTQNGYRPQPNANSLEGCIWGQNFSSKPKTCQYL